ncbi:MAG: hypothetical protein AAF289_08605 [Cyanobacteria bacterium P01_A01_bin.135]
MQKWQCYHHFSVQSPGLLSRTFSSAINTLLYAPDGKTLLTSSEDWDSPIQLWNLEILPTSPFASPNSPVQLWNLLNGQPSRSIGHWKLGRFSRLALSKDGKILVIGGTVIELWNLETGERLGELGSLFGHRDMSALAISPDNTLLATTSLGESPFNLFDYSIRLWDLTTLQPRHTLKGHPARIRTLTFTQDGQTLLSGSQDGTIKSWDSRTGGPQNTLSQPGLLRAIALSPDGEVAIGNRSSSDQPVNAIAFSPDGQHLATTQGSTLTITNADGERSPLTDHSAKIRAIAFSPDSHHLASGDASGQVRLWRR